MKGKKLSNNLVIIQMMVNKTFNKINRATKFQQINKMMVLKILKSPKVKLRGY